MPPALLPLPLRLSRRSGDAASVRSHSSAFVRAISALSATKAALSIARGGDGGAGAGCECAALAVGSERGGGGGRGGGGTGPSCFSSRQIHSCASRSCAFGSVMPRRSMSAVASPQRVCPASERRRGGGARASGAGSLFSVSALPEYISVCPDRVAANAPPFHSQ